MSYKVYSQIKENALPTITHYRDDLLVHDEKSITQSKGAVPFLHFTHETGTHLVFLYPADDPIWPAEGEKVPYLFGTADRRHILEGQKCVIESCLKWPDLLAQYYDGHSVRIVPDARVQEVFRDYFIRTLNAWRS